ncbi:hypothetical protein C6W27_09005 [Bacillus paralicheniformis]|uniref:hypothetical protein n=1 Tax=Bacillus paralicheniformis TaxID=1648923 RepID=UPI000D047FF2|nr:hypothetical protein [Bacillus paralicheniformis]PRS16529.1 hypothetical protein C6W27_09005 [Bacillus paralicheniformis]
MINQYGKPSKEDRQFWADIDDTISRTNVALYGFDISKLSVKEQRTVEEQFRKRWELEEERERRHPTPPPKMTKAERLEKKRLELKITKLDKELQKQDKRLGIKSKKRGEKK